MRLLSVIMVGALLSACALPETNVHTGASAPSLVVNGAPAGAILYVDGLAMGPAAQYDGQPKMLAVLEGAHRVELRQGDTVVFSEQAFVSGGEIHTVHAAVGKSP
jgi:hypothetical protein